MLMIFPTTSSRRAPSKSTPTAGQLAAVLRVRIDPTWDRPTTFERLRTEVPGALTWSERHRGLYAAVIMIPISGFALLLTLAMHRVN